jgi:hypothetical protein
MISTPEVPLLEEEEGVYDDILFSARQRKYDEEQRRCEERE